MRYHTWSFQATYTEFFEMLDPDPPPKMDADRTPAAY